MTVIKKITALLLVLVLLLPAFSPARAAEESTDDLVRSLINYFHYYQGDAQLDFELILDQIEKQDPALAATWVNILEFWTGVNDDMEFHSDVLPDGLPEDDSLCIVVMGYYLKSDGSMRDELYQRMWVTLESAQKYPNAYIMCTGGGTASNSSKVTEAGQMAKWLKKKGIDPDRIIVEEQALSTIQNATYGCRLLYQEYPQIKSLAIITSDYHIYRSCLYFHTQAALEAYEAGIEPMKVVSNATCRVNPGASRDVDRQVEGVGMLTDLDVVDMPKPTLSHLDKITVAGQTEYALGGELNLTVTAHYSSGHTRDVTADAILSGFDFAVPGFQTVTVSYDGAEAVLFDVYVIPPETQPPQPPTEAPTEPEATIPPEPEEPANELSPVLLVAVGCVALLAILLYLKARRARKRRRRPKPTIKLD